MSDNDLDTLPDWIHPLLALARPPARLQAACRRVGEVAADLLLLRQTRQLTLPRPVNVRTYLGELAQVAGVALDGPSEWAGLRLDGPIDEEYASAWGRLASALQLSWPEARVYLCLEAAERAGALWSAPPL